MMTQEELTVWYEQTGISQAGRALVDRIRSSQPVRKVGSGRSNVCGRYPSRKMGVTVQFESHQVELAAIYEMEHDRDVLEYYDQPTSLRLEYSSPLGRRVGALHTPDFFLIRKTGAGFEEWKTEDDLVKLAREKPNRYCFNAENGWICPPGMAQASSLGLFYTRQLTRDMALIVDGIYEHSLRNYKNVALNYPVNYPTNKVHPLTTWTQINQHQSIDQDKYKALFVRLDKRYANRYMFSVAYTLASGSDWNPEANVITYSNPKLDYGPSNIDRRHALVTSGSVMLPWKIQLGGIYTFRSAEPFSVTTTTTNANGTAQFLAGTGRNQGNRGLNLQALGLAPVASTKYNDFDLRVSKAFFVKEQRKLEIIGQAFNLFGFTNYTSFTSVASSATFGQATGAGTVQQGEVAARFTF